MGLLGVPLPEPCSVALRQVVLKTNPLPSLLLDSFKKNEDFVAQGVLATILRCIQTILQFVIYCQVTKLYSLLFCAFQNAGNTPSAGMEVHARMLAASCMSHGIDRYK